MFNIDRESVCILTHSFVCVDVIQKMMVNVILVCDNVGTHLSFFFLPYTYMMCLFISIIITIIIVVVVVVIIIIVVVVVVAVVVVDAVMME